VDDVRLRPARPADLGDIGELIRRAEAHDGVPRILDDGELAQDLAASYVDLDADTRVAERGGELVGWAYVWHPPAQQRLDRADLHGEVAPAHRGAGIGGALLAWSVERARQRLAARTHDLPRFVRVAAYDWLEDRHRLYRRAGFDAVRWGEVLLRALDEVPPVPHVPGIVLLAWPDDRDEELRHVRNRAFADHWGSTAVEPELWQDFVGGHGARPDLSVVAVDETTGEAVGLCVNQSYPEDEAVTGRKEAWIANVATVAEARGKGIASAMISWSLGAFAAAGFSHAALEVDTDNPTGAARLYRNLGFGPLHRTITYELEVAPPP
jgi:ribosomal protein S18 acetylase RimI-like enzyme